MEDVQESKFHMQNVGKHLNQETKKIICYMQGTTNFPKI